MQETKTAGLVMIGVAIAFGVCLGIGILDKYGYLDPILDFLGVPK